MCGCFFFFIRCWVRERLFGKFSDSRARRFWDEGARGARSMIRRGRGWLVVRVFTRGWRLEMGIFSADFRGMIGYGDFDDFGFFVGDGVF